MKKVLWVMVIGVAIITGCKKKEEKTEFNKEAAQGMLPIITEGTSQMFSTFFNPNFSPYKLKNFQDCIIVEGDTTDNDEDGYVKNAIFYYDCEFSYPPNNYIKMKGKVIIKDYNDNDSTSGFYVKIENFQYTITGQQSISFIMNALYEITQISPEKKGRVEYSFDYQNARMAIGFDFLYTPHNENKPWEGGTFNFEGFCIVTWENKEYELNIKGEDIDYTENSNCKYPKYGKITITDGKNYLVAEFHCNTYTATFNGSPIGLK